MTLLSLVAMSILASDSLVPPRLKTGGNLTLLVLEGCPNSPQLGANLDTALKHLGLPRRYEIVQLSKVAHGDPRSGYPAPTILWKGIDLFGMPRPEPSNLRSCRLYVHGLPTAIQIQKRLVAVHD